MSLFPGRSKIVRVPFDYPLRLAQNDKSVQKKRYVTTGACAPRFENLYSDFPEMWRIIVAADSAAHECGQGVSLRRYLPLEKSEKKWGTNGWATSSRELSSSRLVWAA